MVTSNDLLKDKRKQMVGFVFIYWLCFIDVYITKCVIISKLQMSIFTVQKVRIQSMLQYTTLN